MALAGSMAALSAKARCPPDMQPLIIGSNLPYTCSRLRRISFFLVLPDGQDSLAAGEREMGSQIGPQMELLGGCMEFGTVFAV